MSNDKANMETQGKEKKPRQSGSVQKAIFKPDFFSFTQGPNLKNTMLGEKHITAL